MTNSYRRVVEISTAFIEASADGVRYIDLKERVLKKVPDMNKNTLSGALNRFRNHLPDGIIRPVRGLFITETAWAKRDKKVPIPQRVDRKRGK